MPRKVVESRYAQLRQPAATIPSALSNSPQARVREGRKLDRDFLEAFPEVAEAARCGFEQWCKNPNRSSKRGPSDFLAALKKGFFAYLTENGHQQITLPEVSLTLINGFINWLNRVGENGTTLYAVNTQRRYFGTARALFESISELPKFASLLHPNMRFPDNVYDLSGRQGRPTAVLDDGNWDALYVKTIEGVEVTRSRVEEDWSLIVENQSNVPPLDSPMRAYQERGVMLAALHEHFPNLVPPHSELRGTEYNSLVYALDKHHAKAALESSLYPRPFDLVPFVLALEYSTQYNADIILGLKLSSIEHLDVFGVQRIVFDPFKDRADEYQRRSYAVDPYDVASPSEIIDFVLRWTARIRKHASPEIANRLFIFVPQSDKNITSFVSETGPSGSQSWKHNLRRWLKLNDLPSTTIRNLRFTGLDKVHEWTGGDIRAVQAAGGQKRPETIQRHYTSDAARRRNDERLSQVMATQSRWQGTNGEIDPRGRPSDSDVGAATPGWSCADPYDSPLKTEKGKLCSALGACPDCPLATLNFSSAYSLACALRLKDEIELARDYLAPSRWLAVWATRLSKLNSTWLPRFTDPTVWDDAELFNDIFIPELD